MSYQYDAVAMACQAGESFSTGRLSTMVDSSGSTQYCYDRFGNLARKVQTTGGRSFELRYGYTLGGQLQALTYPDGSTVDYVRNAWGQVSEVGLTAPGQLRRVVVTDVAYLPFGPAAGWVYGNGRELARAYDQNYRPLSIHDADSDGLDLGYGYDPVGNLSDLRTADMALPARATFDHDALGRLTAFRDGAAGAVIEGYTYDATGNRTAFTNVGGTQTYSYPLDSHRLAAVGGVASSYNATGNTTAMGGSKEFVYNAANRLHQVKLSGAVAMNYAYTGRGEQVRRYLGATDTVFLYDEQGHLLGEYDSSGAAYRQYLWMDHAPVGVLASDHLYYIQPDHLGTPRVVIEPGSNQAVWKWDVVGEAFGTSSPNEDADLDGLPFALDLRFPGQRYDSATSLIYNYFRDYESATGRYVQSDPLGQLAGVSTYAYVGGNPISRTDPLGLACNGLGCWVTPTELAYANAGNWGLYYQAAAAGGDEYARRAGEVAANMGLRANYTNWRLRNSLEGSGKSESECDAAMEGIRFDLAKAHAKALAGATPQNPRVLTADQISNFHNQVFAKYGAGAVFGGDTFGTSTLGRGAINTVSPWCVSPSCQL